MALFRTNRVGVTALLGLLTALAASGCVEPFGGSNVQFSLAGGVQSPGTPSDFGRPPPGTHFEFHGIEYVTEADESGDEVVVGAFTFEVANFEVTPLINTSSPCFIEPSDGLNPDAAGVHVTQLARKLRELTGIDDPYDPPAGASAGDVIDILTVDRRLSGLIDIETGLKAVTSHDPMEYGDFEFPAGFPDDYPPIDAIDDASNADRLRMCETFWAAHPDKYEGSDEVFTNPLAGDWFGAVDGQDPRNKSFLNGAVIFVDGNLAGTDGLLMNWQYNCDPADFNTDGIHCTPDYPSTLPDDQKSDIGVHYLSGDAVSKARGVINVPMTNRTFSELSGEAVIFADLNNDTVQF